MLRTVDDLPLSSVFGGLSAEDPRTEASVTAESSSPLVVPSADLLFKGDYHRQGFDLVLTDEHDRFVIHDYFRPGRRPDLRAPEGASLAGDVVEAMTLSDDGLKYAQAGASPPPDAIGRVESVSGTAAAIRNGVRVSLNVGDLVYKGDTVQTDRGANLAIVFLDGTTFTLSASARMVLNDMVYQAGASGNKSLLSLVEGSFSFVAGQVAKTGDMKFDTPVATMGIRGTKGGVVVALSGMSEYSLYPEDGEHQIVLVNKLTGVQTTLSSYSSIVSITPAGIQTLSAKTDLQVGIEAFETARMAQISNASTFPTVPQGPAAPQGPNDQGGGAPGRQPGQPEAPAPSGERPLASNSSQGSSAGSNVVAAASGSKSGGESDSSSSSTADKLVVSVKDSSGLLASGVVTPLNGRPADAPADKLAAQDFQPVEAAKVLVASTAAQDTGAAGQLTFTAGQAARLVDGTAGIDTMTVVGSAATETVVIGPVLVNGVLRAGIHMEAGTVAGAQATAANYSVATAGVEEIVVETGGGGDTVVVRGDLTGTGVASSTIHIHGDAGNNTFDASGLIGSPAVRVVFEGKGGNDLILGGASRFDVAQYHNDRSGYEVTAAPDGTVVVRDINPADSGGDEGTDTLRGVEFLDFGGTVSAVDIPPRAVGDVAVVTHDSGRSAIDVMANDTDLDGGPRSVADVGRAQHGTVAIAADRGSVLYTPDAGYVGPDQFTYTLTGGSVATVAVTVTQTAVPLVSYLVEVDADAFALAAGRDDGVLGRIVDQNGTRAAPVGDHVVAVRSVSADGPSEAVAAGAAATVAGQYGTLVITADGTYFYQPTEGAAALAENARDDDDFQITAGPGALAPSDLVFRVVGINDAPVLAHAIGPQAADEDARWTFQIPADAFADVDGDALTYAATLSGGAALPSWLTFDGASRTFSGTPPQDYNGAIVVSVTASDGRLSASGTFALAVNPVNDPPVARDDPGGTVAAHGSVSATTRLAGVLGNDSDVEGDTLSVASVHANSAGATSRALTATAAADLVIGHSLVNGLGGTTGFGENVLPANDDASTGAIDITSIFGAAGINFFGNHFTTIYVNNNGNITFNAPSSTYVPTPIQGTATNPIIAAYWYDVDTRPGRIDTSASDGHSTGSGLVYYDLDPVNGVLTVTWDDVGYFSSRTDKPNAYQLQLIDRGSGDFDIVFRYESTLYGGSSGARAGYSAGSSANSYELSQSGNAAAMTTLSSAVGNTGVVGLDVFNVRSGQVTAGAIPLVGGHATLDGAYGTLTLNADGTYLYAANRALADTLAEGQHATDSFTYTVSDGHGGTNQAELSFDVVGVFTGNHAPTGSVAVSGTAAQGETLTASDTLADADGLGAIAYQWQRDGADVVGATGSSYLLGQADVGHTVRAVASYTDGHGTAEQVASAATGPVANVNDAPVLTSQQQSGTVIDATFASDPSNGGTVTIFGRSGGTVRDGYLQLTPDRTNASGAIRVVPATASRDFAASFDMFIGGDGNHTFADGFSFDYGAALPTSGFVEWENSPQSGSNALASASLMVGFETWPSGRVFYAVNGVEVASTAVAVSTLVTGTSVPVSISVEDGRLTVAYDGVTYFDHVQLPAGYVPPANSVFEIGARTGLYQEEHRLDNLLITVPAALSVGGGAPTRLNAALVVSDVDDTSLASATASITGNFHAGQDVLAFTAPAGSGISGSYDAQTGVLTLTGTSSLANYQAALNSVTYSNTSPAPDTGARTISFQVDDGGAGQHASNVATATVRVQSANQAPVVDLNGAAGGHDVAVGYTENSAPVAIAPGAIVTDLDSPNLSGGSLTVAIAQGSYSENLLSIANAGTGSGQIGLSGRTVLYGGVAIGTYTASVNGGPLVVSFATSQAVTPEAVQALVRSIQYADASDNPSGIAWTARFTLAEAGGQSGGVAQATITVTPTNDAPVLNQTAVALAGTTEDVTSAGQAVSSFLVATDVDAGPQGGGIAVTGATGGGTWQFSTDGSTWTAFGSVSETAALLLTAATQVRYAPLPNGEESPTFTYRAWDRSAGAASANDAPHTADTTSNGGTTAFSSGHATASLPVTPVNDAPVVSGASAGHVVEDGTGSAALGTSSYTTGQFTASDPDATGTPTWQVVGGSTPHAGSYSYAVDSLRITQTANNAANATVLYQDTFSPNGATAAASFGSALGYSNPTNLVNGREVLDDAHGAVSAGNGTADLYNVNSLLLKSSISNDAAVTAGLKKGGDFTVQAIFDLAIPDDLNEVYGLRLTDRVTGATDPAQNNLGDDEVEILVRHATNNVVSVQLRDADHVAGTNDTLQSFQLNTSLGADQIALRLMHAAGSTQITAAFDYLKAGAILQTVAFTATDNLFSNGELYTRATLIAYTPKTSFSSLDDTYGTFSVDQSGGWTYNIRNSPAVQALGATDAPQHTFQVTATDTGSPPATSAPHDIAITVQGSNDAPVALGQSKTVAEDGILTGRLVATDIDGPSLSYQLVFGPSNGSLTFGSDGSYTYTPSANYNGPDGFSFRATDGITSSGPAYVSVTVTAANDPPSIDASMPGNSAGATRVETDAALSASGTLTVRDADGTDPVSASVLGVTHVGPTGSLSDAALLGFFSVTSGTVVLPPATSGQLTWTFQSQPGSFDYLANGQSLVLRYAVRPDDGHGTTVTGDGTVTITVQGTNDAPTASASVVNTAEDTLTAITLAGTDVDGGDKIDTFRITGLPDGNLYLDAAKTQQIGFNVPIAATNNQVTIYFQPRLNSNGQTTISFKANDGDADSLASTVTVNVAAVNDPPVAYGVFASGNEDGGPITGTLSFSDVEGGSMSTELVAGPAHGTLAPLNGGLSFSYTPAANYYGTDTFTYRVVDGATVSNTATVTLTVNPVNDAPTLTAHAVDPTFTEAPGAGAQAAAVQVFSGAQASTGESDQSVASLRFAVSGLRDGADETVTIDGTAVRLTDGTAGTTALYGLSYAVSYVGGGATVSLSKVGGFSTTVAAAVVDGLAYQNTDADDPTPGDRTFELTQITDTGGRANGGVDTFNLDITSTVHVAAANDAPSTPVDIDGASNSVVENAANGTFVGLTAHAVDPDAVGTGSSSSEPTSYSFGFDGSGQPILDDGRFAIDPSTGVVTVSDGTRLDYAEAASHTLTIYATDPHGASSHADFVVAVINVDEAPTTVDDSYAIREDIPLVVAARGVLANDIAGDADPEALAAILVSRPLHGTLALNADGSFTYTPELNFFGYDSFTYRASDPAGSAGTTTGNLIVNPGAELGPYASSFNEFAPPQGWTTITGYLSAVGYTASGGDLGQSDSDAVGGGHAHFAGGTGNSTGIAQIHQIIGLGTYAGAVDSQHLTLNLGGLFGGYSGQDDNMTLDARFLDGASNQIGHLQIGGILASQRGNVSQLLADAASALLPTGTRSVDLVLTSTRTGGSDNDGLADNLSLTLTDTSPTSAPATVRIAIAPVNDAPTGENGTVTTAQDTAYAFTAEDFGFSDPNDSGANSLRAVKIASLPGSGILTDNGVALSAGDLVSAADIAAGRFKYTPDATAPTSGPASFTFQVQDDGGVALGGADLDPIERTMTLDVTPSTANAAPSLSWSASTGPLFFTRAFSASSGAGTELYVTDGTPTGTHLIDLTGDSASSSPGQFTTVGGKVVFVANDSSGTALLWASDGLPGAGHTAPITSDLAPGGYSSPQHFTAVDGQLEFFAYSESRNGLFITDGTTTTFLRGIAVLGPSVVFNGKPYFYADDVGVGLETSDGTPLGTVKVAPVGNVHNLTVAGNRLFFSGTNTDYNAALYVSDGTPGGTAQVALVQDAQQMRALGSNVVFTAYDAAHGRELWTSDGTAEGTHLVRDIEAGSSPSNPDQITVLGSQLYFTANNTEVGNELWTSDGTYAGTHVVADLNEGSGSAYPGNVTAFGGAVYVTAQSSDRGGGIFRVDSGNDGLRLVKSLNVETRFVAFDDALYFGAHANGSHGLWKTDGTEAGTILVKDTASSYNISELSVVGDHILFNAYNGGHDVLWTSDGTAVGTVQLTTDANPDLDGAPPAALPGQPVLGAPTFVIADKTADTMPFSGLSLSDDSAVLTATVTLDHPDNGHLDTSEGAGSYDPATGIFTMTGSVSDVQGALRGLVFVPTENHAAFGTVDLTHLQLVVSDGSLSAAATVTIEATPVNDAPIVESFDSVGYDLGGSPVQIAPNVTLSDPDGSTLVSALVVLQANPSVDQDDVLALPVGQNEGFGVAVDHLGVYTVTFDDLSTVTASFDSSDGELRIFGAASLGDYQELLRSVLFSTSDWSNANPRTISIIVADDQGALSAIDQGQATVTVYGATGSSADLWTGAGEDPSDWFDPDNWSAGVPASDQDVVFHDESSLGYAPVVGSDPKLASGDHVQIGGLEIYYGTSVDLAATTPLDVNGTADIAGIFTVADGLVTLLGGTTLEVGASAIAGAGATLVIGGTMLVNEGTVDASGGSSGGGTIQIQTDVYNLGILSASGSGAHLQASGITIEGSGTGLIYATSGAEVTLHDVVVVGGHLHTDADSVITIEQGSTAANGLFPLFDGTSLVGEGRDVYPVVIDTGSVIEIASDSSLTLRGSIVNHGTIYVDAIRLPQATVLIDGHVALSGGGHITSDAVDPTGNVIHAAAEGGTLVNADNTITRLGEIGSGTDGLILINDTDGHITADGHFMKIDTGTNLVLNYGYMSADGGGTLDIRSAVSNDGHVDAVDGTIIVGGDVLNSGAGAVTIVNGILDLKAALSGDLAFVGDTDVGTLVIDSGGSLTGRVSGLSNNDKISFVGISGLSASLEYVERSDHSGGTLTVGDADGHEASLSLNNLPDHVYAAEDFYLAQGAASAAMAQVVVQSHWA